MAQQKAMEFVLTGSKESRKVAAEMVQRQLQRDPFAQFMGAGNENCVITVGSSAKEGSSCTIFLASDLTGDGVRGNQNLDENEDKYINVPFTFKGDLLANSFTEPTKKLLKHSALNRVRRDNRGLLTKWFALKTIKEKFYTISYDPTNLVIVKHDSTVGNTTSDLEKGDTFNTYVLDEMLNRAENGWTDANGVEHPPIETYFIEKETEHDIEQYGEFYPVFVGPKSYAALLRDPRFIEAQKTQAYAKLGSYVKGFAGVYRNAVIIKVPKNSNLKAGIIRSDSPDFNGVSGSYTDFDKYKAGDGTVTELNFLMGAGALALAFDEEPEYGEDNTVDSGRKVKFWADQFFGAKKVRWVGETNEEKQSIYHDKDYAVIVAPSTIE